MSSQKQTKTIYLAGPMRGFPRYNFDAFETAEQDLIARGFNVLSPHRKDLEMGFNPDDPTAWDKFDQKAVIEWDVRAVMECELVVMLPNWQGSQGANMEKSLAAWLGKEIVGYPDLTPIQEEDILTEAYRLTSRDRQSTYGPPNQDFSRTARMWSALKGVEFQPHEVAMFMIALKLSRLTHANKRDNWTDMAGYSRCGYMC